MHCPRILMTATLTAVVVAGCWSPGLAATSRHGRAVAKHHVPSDLSASFQTFCVGWMEKVWARESQNVIGSDANGATVPSTYVKYSREYGCTLVRRDPAVGKINYRELRYERRDDTGAHTDGDAFRPIEIVDTDEYFTYIKGKWQ